MIGERARTGMGREAGFTLIELTICVAIIGILSTMAALRINNITSKTRDKVRLENLHSMDLAINAYRAVNDHVPITKCSNSGAYTQGCLSATVDEADWAVVCPAPGALGTMSLDQALAPYFQNTFHDPKPITTGTYGGYCYQSLDGSTYTLSLDVLPEDMRNYPSWMYNTAVGTCDTGVNAFGQCTVNSVRLH